MAHRRSGNCVLWPLLLLPTSARCSCHIARSRRASSISSLSLPLTSLTVLCIVPLSCSLPASTPSLAPTPGSSPRTHVFAKNRRFMSLTHRYISKDHNQVRDRRMEEEDGRAEGERNGTAHV